MYKTETHLHVAEVSPCSKIKAEEMIKLYHDNGYKTVCVSDHFYQRYFDSLGDIPWADKISAFLSGYRAAKKAGEALGMNIIMSAEVAFAGSPNHYLFYGISEEFLINHPELHMGKPESFITYARENGIFVVQAHPNRDGNCIPTPEYVDCFEVYNSNPRHNDYSEKSSKIASEFGLYTTGGSDAHRYEDIAGSGIMTETEIKTAQDLISAVKSGKIEIIKR